jgi:hypothetical protein
MVNYIAKITKEAVAEEKGSQFYSLLVDGHIDTSTIVQMALSVKYCGMYTRCRTAPARKCAGW